TGLDLTIPLSGPTVPTPLKRIELVVECAGKRFAQTFPAAPNQSTTFTWDGLDAYGRVVRGTEPVSVRIGYVYDGVYTKPAGFGSFSTTGRAGRSLTRDAITGNRTR